MILTCCLVLNSMGDDFDNQKKRQQYCLVQNSIWKPSLSETQRMQHTVSTIVFSCYLKKNYFHLEFLFHHNKFFKLISGRETPGCRLHLSSWCPLFPAVRKFYCIIAPFFVAYSSFKVLFLLASVQPKINVLLFLKRRMTNST